MLRWLIGFSLKNSALVVVVAGLLVAYVGYKLHEMPVDVFPELNAPTVVIMTEAGGLAADEVEQYVTFPIESAVNGVPGVRRVRSSSAISLSIVWVEFDWEEDIYRARQLVNERLATVEGELPNNVHTEIAPITSITGEVMLLSLTSNREVASERLRLREFAEYDLSTALLAVPGVAKVVSIGGELPEYQINVRERDLKLYDLTLDDVVKAAEQAHSIESGGYIANHEGLELPIRQQAQVRSIQEIKSTVVRYVDGVAITIADVADVVKAGALKRGTAAEAGKPAVVLSIQKAPGVNTLELTQAIDQALDAATSTLPEGVELNRHVFRQSDFIQLSVDNVLIVARDAAIFVAIVLLLFLMNIRTTFITLTALPISIGVGLLVLWKLGLGINVMTLGGLAVAIGELVDDAIIDVENVFKRLRENRALAPPQRRSIARVVFDASNEIRSSVVFATIIIAIVFVPLLFLEGLEGRFFRPLGIAYIVTIGASLVVALTVTPALCKYLLGGIKRGKAEERESFLVRWLKRVYRPTLGIAIKLRWVLLPLCLALTGACLWFAGSFGTSFLPEFNEGTFTVFLMAPPGTSLDESNRLAAGVEARMASLEGVKHVVRRTGRAERDEHAEPVSSSEIEVSVKSGFEKNDVRREIDNILADVPGITTMIGQPIEHRLSHILSGTPAAIAINVYGENLDTLRAIAKDIESELRSIPGARDVNANREVMIQTLPVEYDHVALTHWGLTPASAAGQVKTAFYGTKVATVNEGTRRYDLVVRLHEDERQSPEQLKALTLRGEGGALVALDAVARIGPEQASNLIVRENARRKAVVSVNVAEGYNLGHLVTQVREKVDPIVAKHGYSVSYGGQFEAQQSASRTIFVLGGGVVLVMFLLLLTAFKSARAALLVMINLPLALIGGIVAVYVTAADDLVANTLALFGSGRYIAPVISISSMVGFVTLFGIAVRNGILLVNHYLYLIRERGVSFREAVFQGSEERLVPILMTALTAVLGLVPLALAAGEPGSELLAPLAVVVLGGLITSTFLNLVVVPAGFVMFFGKQKPDSASKQEGDGFIDDGALERNSEGEEI